MSHIKIKHLRKILCYIFMLAIISGCAKPVTKKHERCTIFGACISIIFDAKSATHGEKLISTIKGDLVYLVSILESADSKPMLRLNGLLRSGEWSSVNPSVFSLLKKSKVYYQSSQGYFNPARSGLLMKLWDVEDKTLSAPPGKQVYEAIAKNSATMDDIELVGIRARSINTSIGLDFGTLLHGYTVDMVFDYLKSAGAKNIRVGLGNTVRITTKENELHIEHIRPLYYDEHNKIGATTVAMKDGEALCVSKLKGDNDHLGGSRYTTIFNPMTGKPARETGAVMVVHQSAMAANAACQALFIAGPGQWRTVAKSMGTIASLYIPVAGKLQMSMPMLQRIETEKQQ